MGRYLPFWKFMGVAHMYIYMVCKESIAHHDALLLFTSQRNNLTDELHDLSFREFNELFVYHSLFAENCVDPDGVFFVCPTEVDVTLSTLLSL